ncbi:glycosyltransferase AER61, putative [Acanthamoeba castellanii str. Neff]|uniref:EGF domain-specific O-linked N-acetylglucosamine transferase n=1 Tax=Acanthamoeba castellanii (strain ATCC 30010 / Neff) TaxID=1257118 RepID=L8GTH4_ACACF|nr:glycosyltransferase AER61, putative [Acanthamoeba castellanii str. Neff]ELR16310.1 glycosyltransferase AER61, putative [Acanthamoeba castellanii str. Neff]
MKTRLTTNQTALLVVVLLSVGSLLYFAWLSAPRSNDERLDRLAGALAESISAQERTERILLRLAEAVGGEFANLTRATIESGHKEKEAATYPLNAYKRWLNQLGATPTERACEERTGLTLEWCKNTGGQGRVECYKLQGWGSRSSQPDTICEGFNLVVDFDKIPWNPPREFDSSGQNRHPHFGPEKSLISSGSVGSFSAQCQVDRSIVKDVNNMLGTENKFSRALWNNFAEIPADQSTECGVVYENPVVVIMRYEAWNMYHQLGEWINAFTTLEVVDKLDKNTQVLLLDMHEKTEPFTDMLKVFSPDHPLVLGKELVGKGKVCFKDAIMPWEGYGTFIHNNVWRASHGEPCLDSDILEAFSHFVLNKLGMLKHNIPNEPRITLILRKDYMGRKLDRKISNEDQVVKALEEVSRGRASFSSVQLETMTFKEQVELMYSKTNILIGVHGAGLSHTVFLPPEAILIELLPDSVKSFTYFRNLAKQSNHIYIPVHVSHAISVDIDQMKKVVDVAISIASSFNTQMGKS